MGRHKAIVLLQHNYRSDNAVSHIDALVAQIPKLVAWAFRVNGLEQKKVEVWSDEDADSRSIRITILTDSLVPHDDAAKNALRKDIQQFFYDRCAEYLKFNLKVITAKRL